MTEPLEHHRRQEYCTTRPKYRQGRHLKAVKVYTVVNESKHLLVFGVPKINLSQELKRTLQRYGQLEFIKCVTEELSSKIDLERFTDVYHVSYRDLASSRRAKRLLDAKEYYGGILHISYAPEYESPDELRLKLQQRRGDVERQMRYNAKRRLKEDLNT